MHKSSLKVVAPKNTCPPKVPLFCCAHITPRLIKKVSDEKNWNMSQKPGISQFVFSEYVINTGGSAIKIVAKPKAMKYLFNL